MRPKFLVTVLVWLAIAITAAPAHADGIVSICDEAHLRLALVGGGTVTFSCSGTISLTAEIVIAADTTIDGSGQTVTISGNNAVRVFTVNSGAALNLNELTVAHGIIRDDNEGGGGMFNNHGTVTISNSTFSDNRALVYGFGGGILNYGTLTISNSIFSDNIADREGGGIENYGPLTISNSTFTDNRARIGAGFGNSGMVTVSNSTFSDNRANLTGGGVYNVMGTVEVSNSTFSDNRAHDFGGGILNNGTLTIGNNNFSGNRVDLYGGGICNDGNGTLIVSNSTFFGNNANFDGDGIYNRNGMVILKNSIVGDCFGICTDGGGNLGSASAMLGPLQNNGGATDTMMPGPGSPTFDAANDATCAAAPVNNVDQRGVTRPQGGHCDIGAVERLLPFRIWLANLHSQ